MCHCQAKVVKDPEESRALARYTHESAAAKNITKSNVILTMLSPHFFCSTLLLAGRLTGRHCVPFSFLLLLASINSFQRSSLPCTWNMEFRMEPPLEFHWKCGMRVHRLISTPKLAIREHLDLMSSTKVFVSTCVA